MPDRRLSAIEMALATMPVANSVAKDASALYKHVLERVPDEKIGDVLTAIMLRFKFRPTPGELLRLVAEVIWAIPGPDEAWAIMLRYPDEPVLCTVDMRDAFKVASTVIEAGDMVGARKAFIEAYEKLIVKRIGEGSPPTWMVLATSDKEATHRLLLHGIETGLLSRRTLAPYQESEHPPVNGSEHTAEARRRALHDGYRLGQAMAKSKAKRLGMAGNVEAVMAQAEAAIDNDTPDNW